MSDEPKFIRAFIAVKLPSEISERLEQLQRSLKYPLARAGITWAKPGQVHLTLKFLGDIAVDSAGELQAAIRAATVSVCPFGLGAIGLGVFPGGERKPRVIWVGVQGDIDVLRFWQEKIECATGNWRAREARGFQPHLTLGRIRHITQAQAAVLREKIQIHHATDFGAWRVNSAELIQSTVSPAGAEYFPLQEFPLGEN